MRLLVALFLLVGLSACAGGPLTPLLPEDAKPKTPLEHLTVSAETFRTLTQTATVAVRAGMLKPNSTMGDAVRAAIHTGEGALVGAQRAVALGDESSSLYWLSILDSTMRSLRLSLLAAQANNVKPLTDPGLTPEMPKIPAPPPKLNIPDLPPPIDGASYAPDPVAPAAPPPAVVPTGPNPLTKSTPLSALPQPISAGVIVVEASAPVESAAPPEPVLPNGMKLYRVMLEGAKAAAITVGE